MSMSQKREDISEHLPRAFTFFGSEVEQSVVNYKPNTTRIESPKTAFPGGTP